MISPIRWLQEPEDVRLKLATEFKLEKSGGRSVENNKLVSDGYSAEELYKKFSVKALQEFTELDIIDVHELFAVAVELVKAETIHNDEKSIPKKDSHPAKSASHDAESGTGTAPKRRGRPKKQSQG